MPRFLIQTDKEVSTVERAALYLLSLAMASERSEDGMAPGVLFLLTLARYIRHPLAGFFWYPAIC